MSGGVGEYKTTDSTDIPDEFIRAVGVIRGLSFRNAPVHSAVLAFFWSGLAGGAETSFLDPFLDSPPLPPMPPQPAIPTTKHARMIKRTNIFNRFMEISSLLTTRHYGNRSEVSSVKPSPLPASC